MIKNIIILLLLLLNSIIINANPIALNETGEVENGIYFFYKILLFYVLTLIVETSVAKYICSKKKYSIKIIISIFITNIISYPIFTFTYILLIGYNIISDFKTNFIDFSLAIFGLEILVIIFEALIVKFLNRKTITIIESIIVCTYTNISSLLAGTVFLYGYNFIKNIIT